MRKALIVILILLILGGGSWLGYQKISQQKEAQAPEYDIYTVERGDIFATVSATGVIEPSEEVKLSFRGKGKVKEILVAVGDAVTSGQLLARLEDDELQLQLKQAQVNKKLAEANLAKAKTPADETDIAAAQAQVESAEAQLEAAEAAYQDLLRGPSAAQRKVAESQLKRAEVALKHAQENYDKIATMPNASMMPQAIQLEQATIDYETAKANLAVTLAPATASKKAQALSQISTAKAALAQAEANLARLQAGPKATDLAVLETQVEQSEIGIQSAALSLENTQLIAPIDGIIDTINIHTNEFPPPSLPAMIISDPTGFHIKLNVDELDIGHIRVGQTARVTVDALDDAQISGVVSHIAPAATSAMVGGSTIVTYEVIVNLDDTEKPLRSGMTATVTIITEKAEDVLVVPNRVMHLDETTRTPYVEKLVDGVPTRVDIELGLRNEQMSVVLSGLEAGDELAIRRVGTGEMMRKQLFGGG